MPDKGKDIAADLARLEGLLALNMKLTTFLLYKHFGTLDIDVVTRAIDEEVLAEECERALRGEERGEARSS